MAKYIYSGFSVAKEEVVAKKIKTKGVDFNAILAKKAKLLNTEVKQVEESAPVVDEVQVEEVHKYSFEQEPSVELAEDTSLNTQAYSFEENSDVVASPVAQPAYANEQHVNYPNVVPSIANQKLPEEIFREKLEKCEEGTITHVILTNIISQIEEINKTKAALVSKKEDGLAELQNLYNNLVEEEVKLKEEQALELQKLADRKTALEEQTNLYSNGMDEKIKALDVEKANIVENTNAELPKAQEADELTKRVGEYQDRQQKIIGGINPALLKGLDNEPEEAKKPFSIFNSFRVEEEESYRRAA